MGLVPITRPEHPVESNAKPTSYDEENGMVGYKNSSVCKICKAKNRNGALLRDYFDRLALHATTPELIAYLNHEGIMVSEQAVRTHLKKHAPYVAIAKKQPSPDLKKVIVKIHQEKVEVSEALQRIVDIGDTKVQDGSLPVTERLYVEALKEQGRRGVKTSIDTEFETMDEELIKKIKADGQSTT